MRAIAMKREMHSHRLKILGMPFFWVRSTHLNSWISGSRPALSTLQLGVLWREHTWLCKGQEDTALFCGVCPASPFDFKPLHTLQKNPKETDSSFLFWSLCNYVCNKYLKTLINIFLPLPMVPLLIEDLRYLQSSSKNLYCMCFLKNSCIDLQISSCCLEIWS